MRAEGNSTISTKRGHREETGGSGRRRPSPREDGQADAVSRRRGRGGDDVDARSRSRRRREGGRSSRSDRTKKSPERLAANASSPPSVRSSGSAKGQGIARTKSAPEYHVVGRGSKRSMSSNGGRAGKRHRPNASGAVEENKDNEVKDYLVKVEDYKASIDKTLKAAKLASWPATKLQKLSFKLTPEGERRLLKKGNFKEALKQTEAVVNDLSAMRAQLDDLDANQVDSFGEKLKQAIDELTRLELACTKYQDACNFILGKDGENKRAENLATAYQLRKWKGKLVKAGWQENLAAVASQTVLHRDAPPIVGIEEETKWDQVMVFDAVEAGYGKEVHAAIGEYQIKCSQHIGGKSGAMIKDLLKQEAKKGRMGPLACGPDTVNLNDRLASLPKHELHDWEGSGGWAKVQERRFWRFGPAQTCLPGLGAFVQLAPDSKPMHFLTLPLQPVTDEGLIDLADLPNFLEKDGGQKVAKEHCSWFCLEKTEQVAWVPYGTVAIGIAHFFADDEKDKEKTFSSVWWLSIFNKALAKAVKNQTWQAICKWNGEHLQSMSGQELWAKRQQAFKKLADEVAKAPAA